MQKKRAVAHVEGNFASSAFIKCPPIGSLIEYAENVTKSHGLMLIPNEDWHISLSKPLYLKHFQIDLFMKRLTEKLSFVKQFNCSITSDVICLYSEGAEIYYTGFKVNVGRDIVIVCKRGR